MALTRLRAFDILDSDFKNNCRVTSTSNITSLYTGAPNIVDGVTLVVGDRVLVQGQATTSQNGIYRVTVVGTGTNGTWVRDTDAAQPYSLSAGAMTYVAEGTTYSNKFYYVTTLGNIIIDTTGITFTSLTAAVGATNPGGSNTFVQFNDGGIFGGAAYLQYNKTSGNLVSNSTTVSTSTTTGAIVTPSIGVTGNINANAYYGNYYLYSNGNPITTPAGGGNSMVQFNSSGSFTGATYLQYNLISGNLVSNSTTTSTSTTTGAVVVPSAGISGNLYVGNIVTTSGIYYPNGATAGGGASGGGNTMIQFSNAGVFGGATYLQYNYVSGNLVSNSATTSTSTTTGALVIGGGVGVGGNINASGYSVASGSFNETASTSGVYSGIVAATPRIALINGNASATWEIDNSLGTFRIFNPNILRMSIDYFGNLSLPGAMSITNTSVSTSATTGAIVISGGMGVGGAVYANNFNAVSLYAGTIGNTGSTLTGALSTAAQTNITSLGSLTSLTMAGAINGQTINGTSILGTTIGNTASAVNGNLVTAAAIYAGTIGNTGAVHTGASATFSGTTNTSGLGTGALIISQGGAAIQQDLYVGGNIYAANIISQTSQQLVVSDPLIYLSANAGSYNYEIGFYSHFVGGNVNNYQHTGLTRNHINNQWYLFSNLPEPSGGVVDLANTNIVYDTIRLGSVLIQNTTTASSTTSGALQVAGGASIVGALYANNFNGTAVYAGTIGNTGTTLTGTLSTAAQTNITSLGALTSLTMAGAINGQTINGTSILGTTIGNTASAINGNLVTAAAIYAGTIGNTSASLVGTISTAAQTNITSLGALTSLTMAGAINGQTINGTSILGTTIGNTASAVNGNIHTGSAIYAGTIGNSGANHYGATVVTTGNIYSGGNIVAASGTATNSTTTGAIVVTGGVGVSANVYTGGNIYTQQRQGFTYSGNNTSVAYTYYNATTNSLDTVFG